MIDKRDASAFEDIKVHVRFKLFALWSSVMFFYIYGDYFELFQPGKLQDMLSGRTPLGAMSQGVLLGMSAIMVIPSLMPFLTLVLPAGESLGEYRVWRSVQLDHDFGDPRWLALLCVFRINRNHPDNTHRVLRMDLAEAESASEVII
jgi:hypothetical protein